MKYIVIILSAAAVLFLGWYLFIRQYEFEVNFEAKTSRGDLIETIRIWDRSMKNTEVIEVDSFNYLKQKIKTEDRNYLYTWNFEKISDSTTHVNIKVTQPEKSLQNKFLVPFSEPPIEKDASIIAYEFYNILKKHLEITKVEVIGVSEVSSTFCICRNIENDQVEKASGMMRYYDVLVDFVNDNNIEVKGPPIVKVNKWRHSLGKISYDFCFPIIKRDNLPEHPYLTYKEFPSQKAIKANYFGNYITSDRAWYSLIEYAERNGYITNNLPIEFFHDNPNHGINEKGWKAEVFLPIK